MTTITIYSTPGSNAVNLSNGALGSEVDLRVVSTVDGRGEEPGCTVLEVAAQDVAHVESALDDMDAVASYSTRE
jgi:hypothetical protein